MTFEGRKDDETINELGICVQEAINQVEGGVLLFFSSYVMMDLCLERWEPLLNARITKKELLIEQR